MNWAHLKIRRQGYTLGEVIVVIIILGILTALALPSFSSSVEKTKTGEGVQILEALRNAQNLYKFENGSFADDSNIGELHITIPSQLKHFNTATMHLNNPGGSGKVAEIKRNGDLYTLEINDLGHITCTNSTPATLCARMGF